MNKTKILSPIFLQGGKQDDVDVVCYYSDMGLPYREHVIKFARSVKNVMPNSRRILMTPNAVDLSSYFNHVVMMEEPAAWDTLMADRTIAHIRWAAGTNRRTVFCDCDLEMLKPPVFDGSFDVGLLWRGRDRPDMPICASMILMEPGLAGFNQLWAEIIVNIPDPVKRWWCDQISLSLMTGVTHSKGDILEVEGARVKLLDYALCADKPEKVTKDTWALHSKGAKKGKWSLDVVNQNKRGGGTLLRGLPSYTAIPGVLS